MLVILLDGECKRSDRSFVLLIDELFALAVMLLLLLWLVVSFFSTRDEDIPFLISQNEARGRTIYDILYSTGSLEREDSQQEVPEYLLTKTFRRPKMENVPTLPVLVTHAERF